jgi:hypothetical protein
MAGWAQMPTFYAYTAHSRNGIWRQISDWQPFSAEFTTIVSTMPDEVENAEVWPSLKSIFIKDDIMFIVLDQGVLDKVKQLVKEYNYTRLNENDFILFETIPIPEDTALISVNDIEFREEINDNLVFHCGTYDPFVVIPLSSTVLLPDNDPFVEIECSTTKSGGIQFFYDYGEGFTEANSTGKKFITATPEEKQNIILPIVGWSEGKELTAIRIDPPDGSTFTIHNIQIVTRK